MGGDQVPGKIPADIAFIIKDKPHPLFTRDGVNLKYTYKIPLREFSAERWCRFQRWRERRSGSTARGRCSSRPRPSGCKGTACRCPRSQTREAISLSALTCSSLINSPRARRISSMTCSPRPQEPWHDNLLNHSTCLCCQNVRFHTERYLRR